jgi:hypothetical protein
MVINEERSSGRRLLNKGYTEINMSSVPHRINQT